MEKIGPAARDLMLRVHQECIDETFITKITFSRQIWQTTKILGYTVTDCFLTINYNIKTSKRSRQVINECDILRKVKDVPTITLY